MPESDAADDRILSPIERATRLVKTVIRTRQSRINMVNRRRVDLRFVGALINVANTAILGASVWAVAGHDDQTFNAFTVIVSVVALLGSSYLTWGTPDRKLEATYGRCKEMAVLSTEIEQSVHTNQCTSDQVIDFDRRYQELVGELDENHTKSDYDGERPTFTLTRVISTIGIILVVAIFPVIWLMGRE